MENNFDKEVKKMLENIEVEYTPMDWNLMEEKIEEHSDLHPELEDALIDGMAFDSLHNLESEYNPEHWNLMRERLDAAYAFRRKLMKYKVAEVALVALFIFTLVQFLPIKKIQHQNIASKTVTEVNDNNIQTPSSDDSQESSNQLEKNPVVTTERTSDVKPVLENTFVADSETTVSKDQSTFSKKNIAISTTTTDQEINVLDESTIKDTDNTLLNTEAIIAEESSISNDLKNQHEALVSDVDVDVDVDVDIVDPNIDASLLSSIALKAPEKFELPSVEELNGSKIFSDLKTPIKVRIGMAVGVDANYIMTPYDQKNFLESFNQFAPGYSGGFNLGFQYGKWEIGTGALYSAVTYESRNIFEIKGSFAEGGYVQQGLEGAQLDVLRIPLNLKYNFFAKKKWNVYAYTGTSVNMMVETFYNFTVADVGNSFTARDFATNGGRGASGGNEDELKYESHDGIFEGGQLSKNTFLTANLGFGVERFFTPRMSIFLQPGYQHQFSKGLGPQSDQINSISILTGAKVTLKKRKKSK